MLRPIRKAAIAFVFVTVVGALLARPAAAAPTPEEKVKAREHYQKGLTHYDIKEFPEALTEFKNAYRIVQDPAFLFNIAQCYRKLGQDAEALDYYRNYVRRFPNAPNRTEVDRRIQEIEREQEARSLVGAPPLGTETKPAPPNNNGAANKTGPVTPIAPPPNGNSTTGNATTAGPPPPVLPPSGNTNAATTPTIVATSPGPSATESSPFYTRWWFWTAVGAAVAGAVVIGAVATRGEVGDCHGISPCRTVGQ